MLKVNQLTKYYEQEGDRVYALRDVSFSIEEGTTLSICGASGAGKTTLLNLLGGLDRPSSGEVMIHDKNITDMSEDEEAKFRNRYLGYIFQFHHLLNDFTILENVMLPLLIQKWNRRDAKEASLELLEKVSIAPLSYRHPKELSGGEQQRAAIARALIHKPKLVLADEPTGNLDDGNAAKVFELLCDLNHDLQSTLIVVTHNPGFAKKMSNIMVLDDGKIKTLNRT